MWFLVQMLGSFVGSMSSLELTRRLPQFIAYISALAFVPRGPLLARS
jgi:hypothetical protein